MQDAIYPSQRNAQLGAAAWRWRTNDQHRQLGLGFHVHDKEKLSQSPATESINTTNCVIHDGNFSVLKLKDAAVVILPIDI